jgi:hypothetical protein
MTTLAFLQGVQQAVNADPAFRKLGTADFSMILAVGAERVKLVFEAFEVAEVSDAAGVGDRDVDFVLGIEPDLWRSCLAARARGEGPSLLSMDLDHGLVKARDPLARLNFERFNRSLQAFVDAGAKRVA